MSKLTVNNISAESFSILNQEIQIGGSYKVYDQDILSFAKDAKLRYLLLSNRANLSIYDFDLFSTTAIEWLMRVASGNIIYQE